MALNLITQARGLLDGAEYIVKTAQTMAASPEPAGCEHPQDRRVTTMDGSWMCLDCHVEGKDE